MKKKTTRNECILKEQIVAMYVYSPRIAIAE